MTTIICLTWVTSKAAAKVELLLRHADLLGMNIWPKFRYMTLVTSKAGASVKRFIRNSLKLINFFVVHVLHEGQRTEGDYAQAERNHPGTNAIKLSTAAIYECLEQNSTY